MIINRVTNENELNTVAGRLFGKGGQFNQSDKAKATNGSINALDMHNNLPSSVDKTREQFRKKASETILNQANKEMEFSQSIKDAYGQIEDLEEELKAKGENKDQLVLSKEKLMTDYDIAPDSEEQKNLELIEKLKFSRGELTEDELERLKNTGPLTEYQSEALELDKEIRLAEKEKKAIENQISAIHKGIKEAKLNKLKTHEMEDAYRQAKKIEEEGSQAVIMAVVKEGKDHIDEMLENKGKKTDADETETDNADKTDKKEKMNQEEKANQAGKNTSEIQNITEEQSSEMKNAMDQVYKESEDVKKKILALAQENNIDAEALKGIVVDQLL